MPYKPLADGRNVVPCGLGSAVGCAGRGSAADLVPQWLVTLVVLSGVCAVSVVACTFTGCVVCTTHPPPSCSTPQLAVCPVRPFPLSGSNHFRPMLPWVRSHTHTHTTCRSALSVPLRHTGGPTVTSSDGICIRICSSDLNAVCPTFPTPTPTPLWVCVSHFPRYSDHPAGGFITSNQSS